MSLPLPVVERLYERLTGTYGRDFLDRYRALDENSVKSLWGHELAGFAGNLHAIAWGLENLPERPPNVIEFRNLCRRSPAPDVPRLPEPKADPARVAAELRKLAPIRRAAASGGEHDGKAWARRLIARHEAGEDLRPIALRFARDALKLHLPQTEAA